MAYTIVNQHKESFIDSVGGIVVGSGYDSLTNQLYDRYTYVKRKKRKFGEEENDDLPSSSTAVVNPCNPSPHVEDSKKWLQCEYAKTDKDLHRAQTMMDDLFASQRQIIEAKTPLGKILEEWPFLQCEDILFSHFVTLVNRKRPEDDIRSTARVFCTRSYEVYR